MKRMMMLLVMLLMILFLSGCSNNTVDLELAVQDGDYTHQIVSAERSARFPDGCQESDDLCSIAQGDNNYLVVWMDLDSTANTSSPMGAISTATALTENAYVIDDSGNNTSLQGNGLYNGRWYMVFEVAKSASGFTLYLPDNEELDLGL